jgi:hypothetical protein
MLIDLAEKHKITETSMKIATSATASPYFLVGSASTPHSNKTIWNGSSETCSVNDSGSGSKRNSPSGLWRLYLARANSLFSTA